jgi:hypothetical protein
VWRNKSQDPDGSDTQTLQTNYDDLYGDVLAWLRNGWLDYIVPQCYQYLGRDIMDYRVVTRWWNNHHYEVNFYIGQGPFRLGDPKRGIPWSEGNEIDRQLYFNDSIPDLLGTAYFKSQTFMNNPLGVNDSIKNKFYKYPAIPLASHHDAARTCDLKITSVEHQVKKRTITITWQVDFPEQVRYYVIYKNNETGNPENIVTITADNKVKLKLKSLNMESSDLNITIVDRYRKECEPRRLMN